MNKFLNWFEEKCLEVQGVEKETQETQEIENACPKWLEGLMKTKLDKNKEEVEKLEKEIIENVKSIKTLLKTGGGFGYLESELKSLRLLNNSEVEDLCEALINIKNPKEALKINTINDYKCLLNLNKILLEAINILENKFPIYDGIIDIKIKLEQLVGNSFITKEELNKILRKHELILGEPPRTGWRLIMYYDITRISLGGGLYGFSELETSQRNLQTMEAALEEVLEYIDKKEDLV